MTKVVFKTSSKSKVLLHGISTFSIRLLLLFSQLWSTEKKKKDKTEARVYKWYVQFLENFMETAKMNSTGRQRVSSCILISGCFRYVLSTTLPGLNQELDSLYVLRTERKPSACVQECLNKLCLRNSGSVSEKISASDSILLM